LPAAETAGAPERLGIFGGTFDPPHVGHLAAIRAVQAALPLQRLLLVVANDPWQKSPTRRVTPAADRLAMTMALAGEVPGVEASSLEIDRGGPSYTVETVEALDAVATSAGRPAPQVFLVVGADLVPELGTWKRVADLQRRVTVVAVSRPFPAASGAGVPGGPRSRQAAQAAGWDVRWVDGPQVEVSSSAVREALARDESVDELVPPGVIRCIRQRGLYAVSR
jgi:nicotinate-nucleotide adenylyltransferase